MEEYESEQSRLLLSEALARIEAIASAWRIMKTGEQRRNALNNIRELIKTTFDDYRREIGKVQKAELDELRRQAAALKGDA